jgi:2-acylglycerol O-acyltransferase 2
MSATPPNEKSPLLPFTPAFDTKHATSELTPPPSEHGDSLASSTEPESSAKQEHHVRWAPLKIPLERRLQMLAMLIYISLLFICLSAFLYSLLIPLLWPVVIAYLTFVYLDKAPEQGGRRFEWTRKLTFWKYFAGYYPISLVKV